ncbi:hypothetical protein Hanom_Chr01g00080001 [Helianthus anomalus]
MQPVGERMPTSGSSSHGWMRSTSLWYGLMKERADSGHRPLDYEIKSRLVKCLARDYE